ncbi:hypothetical protein ACSV4D_14680 [Flavobacterium sp. ARAG 55.4]|uniref:hypothetical protein n=1 Tax=Flavobacterium sp. ARAG 55.4 TaxID=3451357 RepID=UPI003F482BED
MIEVFCTNVTCKNQAALILQKLSETFTNCYFNFDLEDCDNILRAESRKHHLNVDSIINLVRESGYRISILDDN